MIYKIEETKFVGQQKIDRNRMQIFKNKIKINESQNCTF